MEIYDLPSFQSTTCYYYEKTKSNTPLSVPTDTISPVAIYAINDSLDNKAVGVFYDLYIAQSSTDLILKKNDIVKIDDQLYTITEAPLYYKGNSNINPYFKLKIKTVNG